MDRHEPDDRQDEIRALREEVARLREAVQHRQTRAGAYRWLKAAIETTQLGITLTDVDGTIVYTNPAEAAMHGYTVDELLGQDVSVFCLAGYRRPMDVDQLDKVKSWRRESVNVRKDGSLIPVMLLSAVVRDAEGRATGIVTTCEDLSHQKRIEAERERLEAQIRQSQKFESLGTMAEQVANDFNHVLVDVLAGASHVLSALDPAAPERDRVEDIKRAAVQASELTAQLMAYAGRRPLKTELIDPNALVRDAAPELAGVLPAAVTVRYDLGDGLPAVEADTAQLLRVLQQLVGNAVDAMGGRSGTVTLATGMRMMDRAALGRAVLGESAPEGGYVYIEVADAGIGMDAETRNRLFDPFFTTKPHARGLGMSTVLGAVRGCGGVLTVHSAPERGTAVAVLLPAAEAGLRQLGRTSDPNLQWTGEGTILVVDEDHMVRAVAKNMLEHRGFRVVTAKQASVALELLRVHADEVVAVILDLGSRGDALFDDLHREVPAVPVIVMSSYGEPETWKRFFGRAPAGFVQKPFGSTTLIEKVRSALQAV